MADIAWWLWLIHLLATAAMFGVIWMVQVVQYPLFERVGSAAFNDYHQGHVSRITLVVLPLMALELISAGLLTWVSGFRIDESLSWVISLVFLLVIWISTAWIQVPQHDQLASQFNPDVHKKLVSGNWIRTISWSVRLGCVTYAGYLWFGV